MAKRASKPKAGTSAGGGDGGDIGGPGPRVVALYGPDAFLQDENTRKVREELEATLGPGGVEVVRYDGTTAELADVLDECRSFDLMQRHKLVVVDSGEKLIAGDNRPIVERYVTAPSTNATLVLRCGKWNKGKLDALIEKVGRLEKCEQPTASMAVGWVIKRAEKRHGAVISREVAQALVERVGPDLGRLDMEAAKLGAAVGPGEAITPELVAELTGRSGEEEIWVVQEALASGDAGAGVATVRDAVTLWRESATGVLYAELDLLRKAHAYARMVEGGERPESASKRARLWGSSAYTVPAFAGRARGGAKALGDLLHWGALLDARSKGGGLSDADRSVEILGLRIAMLGSASRR